MSHLQEDGLELTGYDDDLNNIEISISSSVNGAFAGTPMEGGTFKIRMHLPVPTPDSAGFPWKAPEVGDIT